MQNIVILAGNIGHPRFCKAPCHNCVATPRRAVNWYYSVLRLIGFISCSLEEVVAFLFGEEVADLADGQP
jgi:hypothetical protein